MTTITLDKLARHQPAILVGVDGYDADPTRPATTDDAGRRDMARRLVELGFVRGEPVRVIRRGFLFGDPIAVKIGSLTLALRRFEAALVTVQTVPPVQPV